MADSGGGLFQLGAVRDVSGGKAICSLDVEALRQSRQLEADGAAKAASVGGYVKIGVGRQWTFGAISKLETEGANGQSILATVDFLGEGLRAAHGGLGSFQRGVSLYPHPEDKVYLATRADFDRIFSPEHHPHIEIGTVYPTSDVRSSLLYDKLLSRHFAVLGSTGTGKSTLVALILHRITAAAPQGHIVVLDPHGEYAAAFSGTAKVFNVDNLEIPYWAMNLEEHCEAFIPENEESREVDINVLAKCLLAARKRNGFISDNANLTADSPVPYLITDLVDEIESETGKLEKQADVQVYTRLKLNIIQMFSDRRFRFIFDHRYRQNSLTRFLSGIIRIPPEGIPISIIDLSAIPSEIVNVIVSIVSRLIFDYAVWTPIASRSPILLVCEESQRYLPAVRPDSSVSAERQLERIAREGRKYGVSLGLISQRPSELSATALSQCGTLIAFRLNNGEDQAQVKASLPEASTGLIDAIPTLQSRECIICGEGTRVPVRVKIDDLAQEYRPASDDPVLSVLWNREQQDGGTVADVIRRWRGASAPDSSTAPRLT